MTLARRVAAGAGSPRLGWNVLLLAEGFTASQQPDFVALCRDFYEQLCRTSPFSVVRYDRKLVTVWRHFTASAVPGPALGTVAGDTSFRSTYDTGTKTLALDYERVVDVLADLDLPEPDGDNPLDARHAGMPGPTGNGGGVVAVLVPAMVGGAALSAELLVGWPGAYLNPGFLVTTVDVGWPRVLIRALAARTGLEDEFSLTGPAWETLPTADLRFMGSPNLVSANHVAAVGNPPDRGFAWYDELDAAARNRALTVVPFGQVPPAASEPIRLIEGGGSYRRGVYHSAADCLMRRRIEGDAATGSLSPKVDAVPLCAVCDRYVQRVLTGTTERTGRKSVATQELVFDEVKSWKWVDKVTEGFPFTSSVTTRTAAGGPWWSYDLKVGSGFGGLRIENLKLKGQAESLAGEDFAELIEFRDLRVEFNGGEVKPFDLAAAFASAEAGPVFLHAADGEHGLLDAEYLRGVKLSLAHDFGGRCLVALDLSLVLKGEAADIDPGSQIYAAKVYPQIGLRWRPTGTHAVTAFRGCVRVVLNNALAGGHQHGGTAPNETIASFFTDTNLREPFGRRLLPRPGVDPRTLGLLPPWSVLFDYHRPNVIQDTEIVAVHGPRAAAAKRRWRTGSCSWPPGSTDTVAVDKAPDQGEFDNVHIHGSMGTDSVDPAGGPMVHAPGCGEACVHLHWRWGVLAPLPPYQFTPGNGRKVFMGYPRDVGRAVDFPELGRPLIPPNQDLTVAVTHPSTTRTNAMGSVVTGSQALDSRRKAVWWTVDVTGPLPDQQQVILNPGYSFAYKYRPWSVQLRLGLEAIRAIEGLPFSATDAELLHRMYPYMRWFKDATGAVVSSQVPTGAALTSGGVSLEEL